MIKVSKFLLVKINYAMKKIIWMLIALSCACSSVSIKNVKKDDSFSIAKYKTFNFYDVQSSGDAIGENYKANLDLLKEAITKEMKLKGLSQNTSEPDLLINIGIVLLQKVQTRESSISDPGARNNVTYMGYRNYSWKSETVEISRYREGTVTLDFVDRASNKLVWQGSAESIVPEKEKNVPTLIQEGMQKLFMKVQ